MGTYLNPGTYAYEEAIASEIFVDKSEMILHLNAVVRTKDKYVSVSRPRRFGKTMAADMLCAYYGQGSNARSLFERRSLADADPSRYEGGLLWDVYLGAFDVVRVVITDFFEADGDIADAIAYLEEEVADELMVAYPTVRYGSRINVRTVMQKIYTATARQFVVVIDEWDAPFRIRKGDARGQRKYLDFLRDWLKDKDCIALAYMTGILPIKKYGQHSALNMFDEYSMTHPQRLAEFVGFTDSEVMEICERRGLRFEGMREWYDGYRLSNKPTDGFSTNGIDGSRRVYEVYSPLSVVRAARSKRLENYWSRTETYRALAEYIRMDYDGLKGAVALLMDGARVFVDTSTYQNDMITFRTRDDVLSLLIHLGYLGYDDETSEVFVPNKEIMEEFGTSTKGDEWSGVFDEYEASKELLEATWAFDEERVARLVESAHDRAGNKTYHDEAALSYAIQLAYYAAQKYYMSVVELDSGKGYADIAYLPSPKRPDLSALLIELKYQKDADTALDQIRRQEYPARLGHYKGNMLLVGISYNRDARNDRPGFKHHTCRIERA